MDGSKKISWLIILMPMVAWGTLGDQELTVDGAKLIWNNNSQTFSIAASGSMSASVNYIWPVADGSTGQAILTDGSGILNFGDDLIVVGALNTTEFIVEADGDTYWTGSGSGLIYGHMYVDGAQNIIIALTLNTPTEVEDDGSTSAEDGWLSGKVNLITFPTGGTEHYLTVIKAGTYKVDWELSFSMPSPGANVEIHGGVAIDGTVVRDKGEADRTIANNSDTGNMGATTIINCPNGTEEISLWIENASNSADVAVDQGNLVLVMIGGITPTVDILLLETETGDAILLETSDSIILES